jgi:hypothetical protein
MARHGLRLYASLSEQQRQALWRGEAYPFGVMTPAQRDWFLAPWREGRQERSPDLDAPGERPPDALPPVGPDSRFALTTSRWIVTIEPHDGGARFHWDADPGPTSATATPAAAPAPAQAAPPSARPAARAPATRTTKTGPGVARRPSLVTRRPLLRVGFEFRYAPEQRAMEQLHVPPPPEPSAPQEPTPTSGTSGGAPR